MKTKLILNMSLIVLGIMFSLPILAENYTDSINIENSKPIQIKRMILSQGEIRIKVKNGIPFYIDLPPNHKVDISTYPENIFTIEGSQIKIFKAGGFNMRVNYQGIRYHIIFDVNYYGKIQYQGEDAPKEIAVVSRGDPRSGKYIGEVFYLAENEELRVPEKPFEDGVWWEASLLGVKFVDLNDNQSTYKMTLKEIIEKAKERISGYTDSIILRCQFNDGTSNGDNSHPYPCSIDTIKIKDERPETFTVSLSAEPAEGGTVSGTGSFVEGSEVTVSATANSGWKFVRWTENAAEVSTLASYTFIVTGNRNLVAVFEKIPPTQYKVTLSANPAEGGTVSGTGSFVEGSEVTVTATPSQGWQFVKWTEDEVEVSTLASFTFQIRNHRNLVAEFEKIPPTQYKVTLSASPAEGGTVSGEGSFVEGSEVTGTATPSQGWRFVKWTEDEVEVSTLASFTFQIRNHRNLVAVFTKDTSVDEISSTDIKIFLDSSGKIQITDAAPNTEFELYNLQGISLAKSLTDNYGEASLEIAPYPSGMYLVRVGSVTTKLIKNF